MIKFLEEYNLLDIDYADSHFKPAIDSVIQPKECAIVE